MPTFRITAPDGKVFNVTGPEGSTAEQALAQVQATYKAAPPIAGGVNPADDMGTGARLLAGGVSGVLDVAEGVKSLFGGERDPERAKRDAALKDTTAGMIGSVGGQILATLPAGPVLGAMARGAGAARLGSALSSGGMTTGGPVGASLAARAGDMGIRVAGGAGTGAAAAGLVNSDDIGTGAAIGGALPPALKAAGKAGGAVGSAVRGMMTPAQVQAAQTIAQASGMSPAAIRQALQANVGPSLIPGDMATVPQLLQNMNVSQLARTVHNAGGHQMAEREGLNALERLRALDRISPVSGTLQQSADEFGNALEGFARPAERAADQATSNAYRSIDPFGETAINLPIEQMQGILGQYLGPGTFGKGAGARNALAEATRIGTQELPAVAASRGGDDGRTLVQAVRRMGGLSVPRSGDVAGEVRILQRELPNVINNQRGLSPAQMAERLYEAGYLPDDDSLTLLNALRDDAGSLAMGRGDEGFAAARDAAMGDAPGAQTIPKAVPYQHLDNLRKSIGDALNAADAKGQTIEAGALRQMKGELDAAVERVAGGGGLPGENFPADIADAWRGARGMHQAQMQRFNQGPQAAMFRRGADGLPVASGGDLAGRFMNASRGQTSDANALLRLLGGEQGPMDAARRYIATDAAGQTNALGQLTSSKFNNWRDARSGMLDTLLQPQDNALLGAIGGNLNRAESAQRLGMGPGSNTAQNISSALDLGLLDTPLVTLLAGKVPLLRDFTGPALAALKDSARKAKAQTLGELLADPQALDELLAKLPANSRARALLEQAQRVSLPAAYRAAPVLSTDQ
jgi:hypothetical protein